MKSKKVIVLTTSLLMSSFLFACGKTSGVSASYVPDKIVQLTVDPCPPGCPCRPEDKVQNAPQTDSTTPTAQASVAPASTTPVVTKVSTKSTSTTTATTEKTTTDTTTGTSDDLLSGDTPLPEVSAPPAANNNTSTGSGTDNGTTTQPKTKFGQFIDKIKNIFKKKS